MLGLLHGGSDVVEAPFDGIERKVEVGFTGQGLESGGELVGVVDVLEDSIVVGQIFIVRGEALDHVVKVVSDGSQLLGVEDAEKISENSLGQDRG